MKRSGLFIVAVVAGVATAFADYDVEAAARKADLYFMEGMRQRALGNEDAHYSLLSRAYELTPDKSGREAYEVGVRRVYFAGMQADSVRYKNALSMIDNYFAAYPTDVFAGSYLANHYVHQNLIDKAIAIYEIMEEHKPDNITLVGNHADLLMRGERFDEAIDLYKRLERSLGKSVAITQRISNIKIWQGDTVGAFAEMDSLIALQPRSVEALQLAASAASVFGYPEKSLAYLERAKEIDPTNGTTYYYAANAYKALGREQEYEDAIIAAITGEDLDYQAKLELLRYYIAEVLDSANFEATLAPIFDTLTHQYPRDYGVRKVYASYFIVLGRWSEAAEQVALAIDFDSSHLDDYSTLARLYVSADNYPKAIETLERAIELAPQDMNFREMLSGVYLLGENYDKAIEVINDALKTESLTGMDRSRLLCAVADAMQNIPGRESEATAYYEDALAADFSNSLAMNNYAYFLATHSGDLLKAKELIARAVLYNPGSATYYDTYAWVMFKLGDLQEAKRYIDLAILSENDTSDQDVAEISAEILDHAAQIYDALGQPEKAEEYRSRIVDATE